MHQKFLLTIQEFVEKNPRLKKEQIFEKLYLLLRNIRRLFSTKFLNIQKDTNWQKHYRKEERAFKKYKFKGYVLENEASSSFV